MIKIMKLKVVLEPSEDGGYTVYVPALRGCISEGDTHDEALANIREAIELFLDVSGEEISISAEAQVEELVV
jgi:predicted RNase H-like HicB family nuclease